MYVEENAGLDVGVSDDMYRESGAIIVPTAEAWSVSNFVLKYKPPTREEFGFLREDMHLGAIFHAEGDPDLIAALCASGVTAYTYEFFRTADGIFPLAMAGGEIAGKMSVIYAAYHLQRHFGGRGVLLADIVGAPAAKVLVIGYGNVGGAAIRLALAMGAEVTVVGTNRERLRKFQMEVGGAVRTVVYSRDALARELPDTDLVIGAINISTYDTPTMLGEDLLRLMRPGSMIIDVTCGYGAGYLPTFDRPTTFEDPVYLKQGVLHCKIDKLPAAVPVTTTEAYTALAEPYLIVLGNSIFQGVEDPISGFGKIIDHGAIVHPVVQEHMDFYRRQTEGG